MLDIRPTLSKTRGIRVNIYRKIDNTDPETGKAKPLFRQIGAFSVSKGVEQSFWDILDPNEQLQLHNWLAETQFAVNFDGSQADDLIKLPIRVPKAFYQKMVALHHEKGIAFVPNHIMLLALEAAIHQESVATAPLTDENSSPVVSPSHLSEPVIKPQRALINDDVDDACRIIFKHLLNIKLPIGQLCTQLEHAALSIGKNKRISPKNIQDWATSTKTSISGKQPKRWHFAIAIDVLQKNHLNPAQWIGIEYTAAYYAIPRKNIFSKEITKKKFFDLFHLKIEEQKIAMTAIDSIYEEITTWQET